MSRAAVPGAPFGTSIRSVPQAAASAETATIATELRRTLTGRLMRGGIIRNNRAPMPRPRTAVIVALAALAMIAGGCGTTRVIPSGDQLTVALTEYRLRPQSVDVTSGSLTIVA